MPATTDTVADRFERATTQLSPVQLATGVALVAAIAFALLFLQEPAAHESLHNFRHAAGITCH